MKALPPDKSADQNGKSAGGGQHGNGRDFSLGRDPRRGHGPARGHGGRPRNEFIARLEALVERCTVPEEILTNITPEMLERVFRISPNMYFALQKLRLEAWNSCADRVYQRPRQEPEGMQDLPTVVEVTRKLTAEEWREQAKQYARAHFPDGDGMHGPPRSPPPDD